MKTIFLALSLFFLTDGAFSQDTQHSFIMKVHLKDAVKEDTLILRLVDEWTLRKSSEIRSAMDHSGIFKFHINTNRSRGYWDIKLLRYNPLTRLREERTVTSLFSWEENDDILLHLSNTPEMVGISSKYLFEGNGSAKYQLRADLFDNESLRAPYLKEFKSCSFTSDMIYIQEVNPFIKVRVDMLNNKKNELSETAYSILKKDIEYSSPESFSEMADYYMQRMKSNEDFIDLCKINYFNSTKAIFPVTQDYGFLHSMLAIKKAQKKIFTDIRMTYYPESNVLNRYYDYIKVNTSGEARERLLIHYFNNYKKSEHIDSLLQDAGSFFQTREGIAELNKLKSPYPPSVGMGYSFIDSEGKKMNLDDLKGKVILIDVYNPGCAPCVRLYKNVISKVKTKFAQNPNFVIVSLSVERKNDIWQKTLKTGLYTSFSSNTINVFTGEIGKNHPFILQNNIVSNPSVILIDASGKTLYINNEILFDYRKLVTLLQTLI
ncbi:Cytochrome oxidase Cu insertion factor, SCO1/SenC/PrrC family [Chryseobacterium taichungense]|uniref:Cytochrome oxidase Cu insertion factor, SCO1/SenC/PrrC family n=1 Tax=Chryseobacterium taichungense TaxID=295069 RepID=A0A1H7VXG5_9FLAO|nr:thioredoxin-like domain-containing protein [Chryseobacterium taichungense]SEM13931.1 Cytochrome oxidase Cu insertion factor, SCO1/SenC/PrrC family [Chryseobacterium taichungense]